MVVCALFQKGCLEYLTFLESIVGVLEDAGDSFILLGT